MSFSQSAGNVPDGTGEPDDEVQLVSETADILEAESLLREAREASPFLQDMNAGDIKSLATSISIVGFDAGEKVMAKGQTATWVGIVCTGELAAMVNGQVVGRIGSGKIVGELAFFTGGKRHADVEGHSPGFIAFIMTQHLLKLFKDAPSTGSRLLRALGKSSLFQLSHNPREHTPLDWNMSGLPAQLEHALQWQYSHFSIDEFGIELEDANALARAVRCHSFEEDELLIDRFADNGGCICFVISGTVRAELNEVHMRTFGEGAFLHDLHYFDSALLPYDIVGHSSGVLGSLTSEAIESLAVSRPLCALALMRRVGNSAVRAVSEDGVLQRNDTSEPVKKRVSVFPASLKAQGAKGDGDGPEESSSSSKPRTMDKAPSLDVTLVADECPPSKVKFESGDDSPKMRRKGKGRRNSVAVFMPKQDGAKEEPEEMEIFHANKIKKQAERSQHNKILANKFQREATKAAEELAAQEESKKGLQRLLSKCREELQQSRESESHFTKLAYQKGKEIERAQKELQQLYKELQEVREELAVAKMSNGLELADKLKEDLKTAQQKAEGVESQIAAAVKSLSTQLESEREKSAEQMQALQDEFQTEREMLEANATKAQARLAEREAALGAMEKIRVEFEEQSKNLQAQMRREIAERDSELDEADHTISLQLMAAKILSVGAALKIALLRRHVKAAEADLDDARTALAGLPAQNESLEQEKQQLLMQVRVLKEALAPMESNLASQRKQVRRVSTVAAALSSQEGPLKAELKRLKDKVTHLEEQSTFLTTSLSKSELSCSRAMMREQKLAKAAETAEKEASALRRERDTLRDSLSSVLQRVAAFESGFGPLLEPKPPPLTGMVATSPLTRVGPNPPRPSPREGRNKLAVAVELEDGPVIVAKRLRQPHQTTAGGGAVGQATSLSPRSLPAIKMLVGGSDEEPSQSSPKSVRSKLMVAEQLQMEMEKTIKTEPRDPRAERRGAGRSGRIAAPTANK